LISLNFKEQLLQLNIEVSSLSATDAERAKKPKLPKKEFLKQSHTTKGY